MKTEENIFKCSLHPMRMHECLDPKEDEKLKFGRYHGSSFPNVPMDRYVVAVLIDGDYKGLSSLGLSDADILDGWVAFLAAPKSKNSKRSKYGRLMTYRSDYEHFNLRRTKEKILMSALVMTDDPKNKNFWGKPRDTK